jgi:hypothetical protein
MCVLVCVRACARVCLMYRVCACVKRVRVRLCSCFYVRAPAPSPCPAAFLGVAKDVETGRVYYEDYIALLCARGEKRSS